MSGKENGSGPMDEIVVSTCEPSQGTAEPLNVNISTGLGPIEAENPPSSPEQVKDLAVRIAGQVQPGVGLKEMKIGGKKLAVCISMASSYGYMLPQPFVFSFLDMMMEHGVWKNYGIVSFKIFKSFAMPLDNNRNRLVKDALQWGADFLLFLDVDQIFPHDSIKLLLEDMMSMPKAGAVSAVYFKKAPPFPPVPGSFIDPVDPQSIVSIDPTITPRFYKADVIGLGCVLFRSEIFKSIPYPWFLYTVYDKTGEIGVTEDVWLCRKIKEAGWDIVVDSKIDSGHIVYQVVNSHTWASWKGRINNIARREAQELQKKAKQEDKKDEAKPNA